jgi:hypothetical protein
VAPVRYELVLYILEDDILHSHCRENLRSYIALTGWALYLRRKVSPVRYELVLYIPEDDILYSHRSENLRFYKVGIVRRKMCRCVCWLDSVASFSVACRCEECSFVNFLPRETNVHCCKI